MTYKNANPMRIDNKGKITGKKNALGYFICTEHYRHKEVCNVFNKIMEKDLNEIVLNKVSEHLKKLQLGKYSKDVKEYKERQNVDLNNYKKIKNEISKQESNFKILYSKKVEGIITEEIFLKEYNDYKQKIAELKDKLNRLENSKNTFETCNEVDKLIIGFENCKNFDNTILKKLIKKITVSKNQEIEIILKV